MTDVVHSLEIVSDPSPIAGEGSALETNTAITFGFSNEEFQKRVSVVMEAIEDEEKFRRCVAEIHTYLSMFEEGFRGFTQEMANVGGPFAMFRKLMGRGN